MLRLPNSLGQPPPMVVSAHLAFNFLNGRLDIGRDPAAAAARAKASTLDLWSRVRLSIGAEFRAFAGGIAQLADDRMK
jgi:hypothetical protein